MKATWDDEGESDSDDKVQEVANMCFMAIDCEVKILNLIMIIFLLIKLMRNHPKMNYLMILMICKGNMKNLF